MWVKTKLGYLNIAQAYYILLEEKDGEWKLKVRLPYPDSFSDAFTLDEAEAQRVITWLETQRTEKILETWNTNGDSERPATEKQKAYISRLLKSKKLNATWVKEQTGKDITELNAREASKLIDELRGVPSAKVQA